MKTKHTSKTLQERLKRLEAIKVSQEGIRVFLANPGAMQERPFYCGAFINGVRYEYDFKMSLSILTQAAELQYEANQYEIAEILEELRLEE